MDSEESRQFLMNSRNIFVICTHKPTGNCGSSYDSLLGLDFDRENLLYKTYRLKNTGEII